MKLISAIAEALSVGAAALASGALSEAGKDAYNRLRSAILRIVSPADLEKLEQKPNSEYRKVVEQKIARAGKAKVVELAELARHMIRALEETGAVGATGISLEKIEAINIRLQEIINWGDWVTPEDFNNPAGGFFGPVRVRKKVHFTVYHPKKIKPEVWCTLLAYVHLLKMQSTVEADAKQHLEVPHGRRLGKAAHDIMRGLKSSLPPNCLVAGSIQHPLASCGSRTGTGLSFVCKLSRSLPVSSWGRPSTGV